MLLFTGPIWKVFMNEVVFVLGLEMWLENQLTELLERSQDCSRENKFERKHKSRKRHHCYGNDGCLAGI